MCMTTIHDVIILGAGYGGLGLGIVLKQHGIEDFVILEKASGPGGTWRDNIYPGAACDTESHLYSFSFEPHRDVSRLYARQDELLRYAHRLVERHGLAPHIRFNHAVTAASWDDGQQLWVIELAGGARLHARAFVAAWGQLNRPQIPAIAGRESFAGLAFHSARWPEGLDLRGQRVASVGNAASAIQYIPAVAPLCARLSVFQRSPNWIVPRGDRAYSDAELARYAGTPGAFEQSREALFAWRETTFERMREGSAEADEVEDLARRHLEDQVPDPALRARLLPDFPLGCKRVLRSDDYYPALCRDNVSLVTEGIARIVPEGIVTTDGTVHEFDVIIWGTGFETQSFQGPVDIHGTDGLSLRDVWKDGARAYKGVAVSGFPNFFLIYGPNTNLGHNSILSMFEAQFGYIGQGLGMALREGVAFDVKPEALETYDARLQAEMAGSAWAGSCTSWYKNAAGRVVNNWSGPVAAYQAIMAQFDRAAYADLAVV